MAKRERNNKGLRNNFDKEWMVYEEPNPTPFR
jgi:hypothetical protein